MTSPDPGLWPADRPAHVKTCVARPKEPYATEIKHLLQSRLLPETPD